MQGHIPLRNTHGHSRTCRQPFVAEVIRYDIHISGEACGALPMQKHIW